MNTNICNSCGRQIYWAVLGKKRIPLDAISPVYRLTEKYDDRFINNLICEPVENALSLHENLCKKKVEKEIDHRQFGIRKRPQPKGNK